MFNLSDKELDRLSRDAADRYEVESNPSSWEALDQRLNNELPSLHKLLTPSSKGFSLPFAYTAVMIAVIGTAFFIFRPKQKVALSAHALLKNVTVVTAKEAGDNKPATQSTIKLPAGTLIPVNGSLNASVPGKNSPTGTASGLNSDASAGNHKVKGGNTRDFPTEGAAFSQVSGKTRLEIVKTSAPTAKSGGRQLLGSGSKNKVSREPVPIEVTGSSRQAGNASATNYLSPYTKNPSPTVRGQVYPEESSVHAPPATLAAVSKRVLVAINDSALRTMAVNPQEIIHLGKKNKSLHTNRSLQIGILTAPDFSKVKYAYNNNPIGNSIGVTLGYQVWGHFSVNSGLLYDHKYYEMPDNEFRPKPNAVPPSFSQIKFITASNKLLEIPLNLRYDFNAHDNTTFFVSSGVSSYLMKGQNYWYFCETPGYISFRRWEHQSYDQPQDFWLSDLNISAGFETSISSSFSFEMEPYVKVPLKGVGLGNAPLSSYGINISLKYAPVLKRSRD